MCEDEDIQRNDHQCWTGERIGDYTQIMMTTGIDTQRYNPEVPLEMSLQPTKFNELVDKLLKIRKNVANAVNYKHRNETILLLKELSIILFQ